MAADEARQRTGEEQDGVGSFLSRSGTSKGDKRVRSDGLLLGLGNTESDLGAANGDGISKSLVLGPARVSEGE